MGNLNMSRQCEILNMEILKPLFLQRMYLMSVGVMAEIKVTAEEDIQLC